ncbi:hypothetical protein QQS21_000346 [Conoideocrella luteorostrata]|uniref:Zn(2)-C6 fungal-type domain-containing protein n=1 Tax=Conoideocrella luteorostrata TaxID=1105319 RepID=A0AAJ0CZ32_9HYPO|nr:hypothetical protein QQS21_000346 [Conoideocrella luteorostrata]
MVLEFRSRRSHEKSRRGCIRCKQQRKKCDEKRPVCSRCKNNNHCCRYYAPDGDHSGESASETTDEGFEPRYQVLEATDAGHRAIYDVSPSRSSWSDIAHTSSTTKSSVLSCGSMPPHNVDARDRSQATDMLNSQELELFSHYITHTSRVLPFDQDDLYALHVGIPNLAFTNRPLMVSIMALSATCKCHDILMSSKEPLERLDEIRDLLTSAEQYHNTSLRQIQDAIHHCVEYGPLLANAALMALYGSSNHRVRVLLSRKATQYGVTLPDVFLPTQSQWITLIRVAHTAYTGLLHGRSEDLDLVSDSPSVMGSASSAVEETTSLVDNDFTSEDGPSNRTERFLLPIICATYESALDKLNARMRSIHTSSPSEARSGHEACFSALRVLENVYKRVFDGGDVTESVYPDSVQLGKLRNVVPWLRNYVGRVTSSMPSQPLRRTIMAFINRVPLDYLHLVQSTLECIPAEVEPSTTMEWDSRMVLSPAHELAMDIFAHWLTLTMLLDGVWWINGIGEWELERFTSFVKARRPGFSFITINEAWWPQSMHNVKKELAQHIDT